MEANSPQSLSLQQEAANEKTAGARLEKLAKNSPYLARLVARNPSAPPELLHLLAGSGDAPTRKNVAANPNTPTEVLLQLGAEFPEELLNNPVFSLLLLEKPNLLDEMPTATLASLVQLETVPVFLFEPAAKKVDDREVLLVLANNPKAPFAALERLAESRYEEVKQAAQLHVNLEGEMNEGWERAAQEEICDIYFSQKDRIAENGSPYDEGIYLAEYMSALPELLISTLRARYSRPIVRKAANPNTPVRVLEQLALDNNLEVRRNVASNPNTPYSMLTKLAKDSDWKVRKNVALHAHTPEMVLLELGKDPDCRVHNSVPLNPDISFWLMRQLLRYKKGSFPKDYWSHKMEAWLWEALKEERNKEPEIDKDFSGNPNMRVSVLELLALDSDRDVRRQVAAASKTPVSLLMQLALDSDIDVRRKVASNPNTPVSLLTQLALDRESDVRRKVASNPNTPVSLLLQLAKDRGVSIRSKVASNPNTPVSLLEELAKDSNWKVLSEVAKNPNTPVSILMQLALDSGVRFSSDIASNPNMLVGVFFTRFDQNIAAQILLGIASNPNIPISLLMQLSKHSDSGVRSQVAQNPNTPFSLLMQLAKDSDSGVRSQVAQNPNTPVRLLVHLAKESVVELRKRVAFNPNTPVTLLVQLAKDRDMDVRSAVAKNPNTPACLLVELAKDIDSTVRSSAVTNPNTPVSFLLELAKERDFEVAQYLATNPKTPVSVLEQLVEYGDSKVHRYLVFNPNTPVSLLEQLLGDPEESILQIAVGRYLVDRPDRLAVLLQHYPKESTPTHTESGFRFSRLFILLHPQVPSNMLAENCRSLLWWDRYAVAHHPNTPPDTLKRLAGDANRLVRAAARANLQNRKNEA